MQNGLSKIKASRVVNLTNERYYTKIAPYNTYTKD